MQASSHVQKWRTVGEKQKKLERQTVENLGKTAVTEYREGEGEAGGRERETDRQRDEVTDGDKTFAAAALK